MGRAPCGGWSRSSYSKGNDRAANSRNTIAPHETQADRCVQGLGGGQPWGKGVQCNLGRGEGGRACVASLEAEGRVHVCRRQDGSYDERPLVLLGLRLLPAAPPPAAGQTSQNRRAGPLLEPPLLLPGCRWPVHPPAGCQRRPADPPPAHAGRNWMCTAQVKGTAAVPTAACDWAAGGALGHFQKEGSPGRVSPAPAGARLVLSTLCCCSGSPADDHRCLSSIPGEQRGMSLPGAVSGA